MILVAPTFQRLNQIAMAEIVTVSPMGKYLAAEAIGILYNALEQGQQEVWDKAELALLNAIALCIDDVVQVALDQYERTLKALMELAGARVRHQKIHREIVSNAFMAREES